MTKLLKIGALCAVFVLCLSACGTISPATCRPDVPASLTRPTPLPSLGVDGDALAEYAHNCRVALQACNADKMSIN